MSCINELLSKNCVPVEFEEFLLKLFQQTFQLLQRITKDTGAQAVENLLTEQDERWTINLQKIKDFILNKYDGIALLCGVLYLR